MIETLFLLAGPVLRGYLEDRSITNIFVNPNGCCLIERHGETTTEVDAIAPDDLDRFLAGVAHVVQQEWRSSSPSLHAAIAEVGWRIQAACPPEVPAITMALRKHPAQTQIYTMDDYREQSILSPQQYDVIMEKLTSKARMVISGETGSGKTSLANAMLYELLKRDLRLCLLEDDPELIATGANVAFFRTSPGVTMGDLVKRSLRYQPDWIIVGEVRDEAAIDMANAFDSGHSGITTVHATNAAETMPRLGELTTRIGAHRHAQAPRHDLLGRVIDVAIHMERRQRNLCCTGIVGVRGYTHGAYDLEPLA